MSDEPAPFEMTELLTKREVAARAFITERALDWLIKRGKGPPVTYFDGRVMFRKDQLDAWQPALAGRWNIDRSSP